MARLNDQANVHSDTIEALKKRYLRQNREIARAHSVQSLRIRTLESETTKLLAENIGLREEIINLQAQLSRRDKNRQIAENVRAIKGRFLEKAADFLKLVEELDHPRFSSLVCDDGPTPHFHDCPCTELDVLIEPIDVSAKEIHLQKETHPQSPHERYLPAIDEESQCHKSNYKKDTELSRLSNDVGTPRKQSQVTLHLDSDDVTAGDLPAVSVGSRRFKRRASDTFPQDSRLGAPENFEFQNVANIDHTSKHDSSANSPLDLGNDSLPVSDTISDIVFLKIEAPQLEKRTTNSTENEYTPKSEQAQFESNNPATKQCEQSQNAKTPFVRKALGTKSVNTDPIATSLKDDKRQDGIIKPSLELTPGDTQSPKDRTFQAQDVTQLDETPIPSNAVRTSRRSRSNISYAEPNLRQKMRREEKRLVDAVVGEAKGQKYSPTDTETSAPSLGSLCIPGTKGSKEGLEDVCMKSMNIPCLETHQEEPKKHGQTMLPKRQDDRNLPSSVMMQRGGRKSTFSGAPQTTQFYMESDHFLETEELRSKNELISNIAARSSQGLRVTRRKSDTTDIAGKSIKFKNSSSISLDSERASSARRKSTLL